MLTASRILSILFITGTLIFGQLNHETRAVWVATNFGLDFPHGHREPEAQKILLKNIFREIKDKNYNTVYFQVRANGTTFFDSEYEPYSPELTGRTGMAPSYDPSLYAIELAREFGLEIHAWVNTFRCFSGNDREPLLDKKHPVNARPDLVQSFYEGENLSYWMDPGKPETRKYLVDLFSELVTKYKFDGLQLDFIRYPGKSFNDATSYNQYGASRNKAEWRRGNVTAFIAELAKEIKSIRPALKIGATPIGIYKNPPGVHGLEAYNDVYQDVESWVSKNLLDYVIPQIYWDTKTNPKFEKIAREWMIFKGNAQIIIGLGAYKSEVKSEIPVQIGITRDIGADGIAMFRFRNISGLNLFPYPALPAIYKNYVVEELPLPANLKAEADPLLNNSLKINWDYEKSLSDKLKYFVLYEVVDGKPLLLKLVDPDERFAHITSARKIKKTGFYTVGTVDVNWNENYDYSRLIRVENQPLNNLLVKINSSTAPVLQKKNGKFLLNLYSEGNENLEINFETSSGIIQAGNFSLSVGLNIITVDAASGADKMVLNFIERKEIRTMKL